MGAALQMGIALGIAPLMIANLLARLDSLMVRKRNAERFDLWNIHRVTRSRQILGSLQVHPVFSCGLKESIQAHGRVRRS
jgi:hypothetical protein